MVAAIASPTAGAAPPQAAVGRANVPVAVGPVVADLNPESANSKTTAGRGQPTLTKLDSDIISAPAGSVLHLAAGRYAAVSDFSTRSGWVTVSGRGDSPAPVIEGASLFGAQYVRFVDVRFSGGVSIDHNPTLHYTQPASHIALENSTVNCGSTKTTPFTIGVLVRGGSNDVTLAGDLIEHCVVGFGSISQDRFSRDITITHCTLTDFPGDAVDLGGLSGVVISHTVISHIADPASIAHNDGIQFLGNVRNVSIVDNVLADSRSQLLFIQDATAGADDHTSLNTNILVARNVIYGAGAVAVQDQGGAGVDFIQNTLWHNHFGSLWLVRSADSGRYPTRTRLVGNIIQGLLFYQSSATVESHNLIVGAQAHFLYGPGDLVNVNPDFVSPQSGDFRLQQDSPARAAGSGRELRLAFSPGTLKKAGITTKASGSLGALQPGDRSTSAGSPIPASRFVPEP